MEIARMRAKYMPVHDWTRVVSGNFHDFHQRWVGAIRDVLNDGRMPEGYYALAEQVAEGPKPDVVALETRSDNSSAIDPKSLDERAVAVLDRPPRVRFTAEQERDLYAESADRVAIRHASGDQIVAYIDIVSPGNKHTPYALQKFVEKLNEALDQGIHLLVIDILPPGKHDPDGVHAALWETRSGESHTVTADEPLGLSAYRFDDVPRAYFERINVGQALPDMPVFLTSRHYVDVPLELTYNEAYRGVPERWKRVIEGRE
jgi:hypothetical protein